MLPDIINGFLDYPKYRIFFCHRELRQFFAGYDPALCPGFGQHLCRLVNGAHQPQVNNRRRPEVGDNPAHLFYAALQRVFGLTTDNK
jgi:hypothetical protein